MADAIHLKLTGIKGESTSVRHKDEIVVESWNWGLTAGLPIGGSGGGAGIGKPSFAPLSFAHRVDIASPLLWKACATGQRIAEALLNIARPLATAGDYLTLRMTDAMVTSVNLADASADTMPPLESVTLTFTTIEYSYRPQLANGSLGQPVTFRFDIRQNRVM
jgi:type VI secretion system secreted protein Hcp